MKKNWADKWVAALRSDKYKQGIGLLFNPKVNEYCCLGVLCELSKNKTGGNFAINGMIFFSDSRRGIYGHGTSICSRSCRTKN